MGAGEGRRDPLVVVVVALALFSACRRSPPPVPVPADAGAAAEIGLASYYATGMAGRRTASGEPYRPDRLTAAHRTLPFGTLVSVTRIDRSGTPVAGPVTVRINDRGPYAGDRILDLSLAAARRLDMLGSGVVRVRVEVATGAGH